MPLLGERAQADRRTLTSHRPELINLAHNDPFLLSKHPQVIARSQEYTLRWGSSSQASRLVTGNLPIHEQLEQTVAKMTGRESALLFASGFQANVTVLSSLVQPNEAIALDRLSHNSLLQGAKLSGAKFFRYRDLAHLEQLLQRGDIGWVVTEGVFSMDGHAAPIEQIQALASQYGARLYVDEAHSFGVRHLGARGDVALIPFGKAVGNFGAAIVCSHSVREHLINFCPGVIYSTALPPSVVGGVQAALELLPECPRQELLQRANRITPSDSHIIPLIVGSSERALEGASQLEALGFLVSPIRPPTVAQGSARLRLSMNMSAPLDQVIEALVACGLVSMTGYSKADMLSEEQCTRRRNCL